MKRASTRTCSPAYAVMGIYLPGLGLKGTLIDDAATWSSLNQLYFFILAGVACVARRSSSHTEEVLLSAVQSQLPRGC